MRWAVADSKGRPQRDPSLAGPRGSRTTRYALRKSTSTIIQISRSRPKFRVSRLLLAGPGNHRPDGSRTEHALMIKLDHSKGANQHTEE